MGTQNAREHNPEFRKLYPDLSDEELIEAQENFDGYLQILWRIFERIRNDPTEYARFKNLLGEWKKIEK